MLVLLNITMTPSNLRKIIIIIREPLYMTKVLSNVMLKLYNVRIEPSNVKKLSEPLNVTKELSYVMLELHNVRMKLSNVRKKK